MNSAALSLGALHLSKSGRGDAYRGTVEFVGAHGKITLHLDTALAEKVLAAVADELVATAERLATQMTANLIQQVDSVAAITGTADTDATAEQQARAAVAAGVDRHRRSINK